MTTTIQSAREADKVTVENLVQVYLNDIADALPFPVVPDSVVQIDK